MSRLKTSADWLLDTLWLLVILWTASCGSDSRSPASVATAPVSAGPRVVVIKQLKFQPDVVTVSAGETVTWRNDDIVPHTATSDAFDSRSIAVGESWSWKAPARPGDYFYTCTLHPNMKAKLTVR